MTDSSTVTEAGSGPPEVHPHRRRAANIDRRELLIGVTALAAAFGLPGAGLAQTAGITAIEFASLSSAIAGFPPADPNLAAEFLAAFPDQAAQLLQLHEIVTTTDESECQSAIAAANLTPLAEAISTAWYTGMVGEGAAERVVTYLDAFAWYAVAYTKPPTRCDISFGAWSAPPRVVR